MSAEVVVYLAKPNTGLEGTFEELIEDGGLSHVVVAPENGGVNERNEAARRAVSAITDDTRTIVWDLSAPIGSAVEKEAIQRLKTELVDSQVLGTRRLVLMTDRSPESHADLSAMILGLMPQDPQDPQVIFVRTPFDLSELESAIGIATQTPENFEPAAASLRRMPHSGSTN